MDIIKDHYPAVILGAGPAGLSAAYELVRHGIQPLVIEKTGKVGGLARTEVYRGFRFDIGGHRFFTKAQEIRQLWEEVLGDGFIEVSRLSRIHYKGHFFNYPLEPWDSLNKLGLAESLRAIASYLKARVRPLPREDSFEEWVTNRFGRRLYRTFFKAYTEKVWGGEVKSRPLREKISADGGFVFVPLTRVWG